jgi:hypothetical protein
MPDSQTGIPNLNDRRIPGGCAVADARSAFQEISVSAPLSLDATGNLPGPPNGTANVCVNAGNINTGAHGVGNDCEHESVLAEFDFGGDAIPINATDLFLQVAYRGPLGLEEDGIAVGIKDIHETNYFTIWNGTDWFYRSGQWVEPAHYPELAFGDPWEPTPIRDIGVCFGNQIIAVRAPGEELQPAEFIRIGVLSDATPVPFGLYAVVNHGGFVSRDSAVTIRQSGLENAALAPYSPQPFLWYGRGTVLGGNFVAPFFAAGYSEDDNTMQSLVLNPDIGGTSAGIPRQVMARFEAFPGGCGPIPPAE